MTFHHHAVVRRCAVATIAFAAFLGWGAGRSAASVGAAPAGPEQTHSVATTRSGTSESAAGMAADQRIARDARLHLSDLPPGWVSDGAASTLTADAPCPSLRRAAGAISAGTISPIFSVSTGNIGTAQGEAYIYADAATAKHWFAEFTSRRTRACLARVLRNQLTATTRAQGIRLGPITARSLQVTPLGDQDVAFRVIVPVFRSGLSFRVDADEVFVRVGRGLEIFSLGSLGSPFDPTLETTLVKTASDRLAADLQGAP